MNKKHMYYTFLITCMTLAVAIGIAHAATLTVTTLSESDQAITATSADWANGDLCPNAGGDVMFRFENTNASSNAVATVSAQDTSVSKTGYGTLTKADETITLNASQIRWVGPFPIKAFNNSSNQLAISYTGDGASAIEVIPFKGSGLELID